MRRCIIISGLAALSGCSSYTAAVSGSASGLSIGTTSYVFFGGPFVVITPDEVDCMDLAWVRPSYQEGSLPTDQDMDILQFSYTSGQLSTGQKSIGLGASVTSTIVHISGESLEQARATGGVINVDSIEEETTAIGSFEGVTYDDGTLDGTFEAQWCINLKER